MYHSFGWSKRDRFVSPRALEEQLCWLESNEVEVIRASTLVDFLDGELELPRRVAVLTIDDGEKNGFTVAYPILKRHRMPFTLVLPTDTVEHHQLHGGLEWWQVREMLASGLAEVASHSHTHRNLKYLSDPLLRQELELPRRLIEERTGVRPSLFFYPFGAHDERVRRAVVEAGYRAAFVAFGSPIGHRTDRLRLPRYDVDRSTGVWVLSAFFRHR